MSRSSFKNYFLEAKLFNRRTFIALIFIVLFTLLLISRLFYLQIIEHKFYATLSEQNQMNLIPIDPPRGLIFDRNGVIVAQNYPAFSLDIIPDRVPNFKQTLAGLQKLIDISPDDLQQYQKTLKQHHPFSPIPLKMKLTDEEVARFYLNQYRFPGVMINAHMIRYYPLGTDMVTPLGYVARINEQEAKKLDSTNYSASDYIGKIGIEKHYENILHGTVGYQQVEIDANGRIIRTLKRIPPIPGENITITIDSKLQHVAMQALANNKGAVVAIQPSTGEVLALASNPSYDPNLFVKGITNKEFNALQQAPDHPLYNRAIRGTYPSGSTVKPFYALIALDTNVVTPNFTVFDPGWFKLPGWKRVFRDWNWKRGGHGIVNAHKAIVVSCDTYFFTLAQKMGIAKMDSILTEFDFGQRSGIDLDEDLAGVVPSPKWKRSARGADWYPGDTINLGIGQGYFLVTPLQLAKAVAIIAEHGKVLQPHLLKKTQQVDGAVTEQLPIIEDNINLKNPNNWDLVINAMEGVVTEPHGTGGSYGKNLPYTIAAKTGTAEIPRPQIYKYMDNSKIPKKYLSHSLFVAFAPAKDPQIVVAAVVENNPHQAVPVVRQVIDYYLLQELQQPAANTTSLSTETTTSNNQKTMPVKPKLNSTLLPTLNLPTPEYHE